MKHLIVFCEGPTEQGFCSQVLQPHLFPSWDGVVHTLGVGEKHYRRLFGIGTHKKYETVRRFILNTIKQRYGKTVYFTTLFDLYALSDDFPGKDANVLNAADPTPYVRALEKAFEDDIGHFHFIPYLQLYEYETILFAEPEAFRVSFENCEDEIRQLKTIAASQPSIEHIDNGKDTAPSKRIIGIIPQYRGRKTSAGPDIAEYIGIGTIRRQCLHFHEWLNRLENLIWLEE